jgi:hypothetical protein
LGSSWVEDAFQKLGEIYRDSDWLRKNFGSGADEESGLPLSVGTVEGTFLGIAYNVWFIGLLILIVLAFLLTVGALIYKSSNAPAPNPPESPRSGTTIAPTRGDQNPNSESSPTPSDLDRLNDFPCEDCSSEQKGGVAAKKSKSDPLDEAALQRERMNAITSGNMDRYNELIQQHRKLYKLHGIDPCKSGFFPQGCE